MSSPFAPGDRVRLRTDTGRVGVITGQTRQRGSEVRLQLQFPEQTQYVPEDQLDRVGDGGDHPLDLLQRGRFARAIDLRRRLTRARLTGRLADVIHSLDTTGVDFYAYQFKPLVKLLNSATTGMLIADEVGLGETIEAGLLWTELGGRGARPAGRRHQRGFSACGNRPDRGRRHRCSFRAHPQGASVRGRDVPTV